MPSANRETLSTRFVEALPASDREIVVWDRELPGFGLRVHPSGSKAYMVHKRSGGKSRRVTIGRHGVWSLDAARREAGGSIASMKNGETPARPGAENGSGGGPTIAELAEQYMTEHVAVRCKPTTARSCRHIFDKYLLPQFGGKRLGEITPQQVSALHYRLSEKATTANQVIGLLSRLFHKAAKSGYAPKGGNPCRFIKKYPTWSCERFLSERDPRGWGGEGGNLAAVRSRTGCMRMLLTRSCGSASSRTLRAGGSTLKRACYPGVRQARRRPGSALRLHPILRPLPAHLRQWERHGAHFVVEVEGQRVGSLKTAWHTALMASSIDRCARHNQRHTAVMWAILRGAGKWAAAGFSGLSLDVLESVYGHHHPDHLRSAVEAMERKA